MLPLPRAGGALPGALTRSIVGTAARVKRLSSSLSQLQSRGIVAV